MTAFCVKTLRAPAFSPGLTTRRHVVSRPFSTCPPKPRLIPRATQTENVTITNEMVAANPWAQPGWRGAYVSSLPVSEQRSIFFGAAAALTFGVLATHFVIGPWICSTVPTMDKYLDRIPFILGPIFSYAGISHFTNHTVFTTSYPHQGAWGVWYLPGTPSFFVNWTGVGEAVAGAGLAIGALHLSFLPDWLESVSGWGMFLFAAVVCPLNFYMYTHNAPGPLGEEGLDKQYGPGGVIPLQFHIFRGFIQVVLLSTFLGCALQ